MKYKMLYKLISFSLPDTGSVSLRSAHDKGDEQESPEDQEAVR